MVSPLISFRWIKEIAVNAIMIKITAENPRMMRRLTVQSFFIFISSKPDE